MGAANQPGGSAAAQIGEQIGGYRLVRRLGDGSTSTVFLGEHVRLGRSAAIKVLAADFTDDERLVQRLLNEARVVNDIRHPNIVDIWDFVEQDDPRRVALVMEHLEGPSLETFRGDPLPPTQALAICLQLVDAVQAAHARGVIHRDLKPANLLLTFDPAAAPERPLEMRVVDFGIAKAAGPHAQGMTVSGTMLGTPAYMAPEQIAGSPPPSFATDVFALGAVIYELLSGKRAYPSPRLQETVRMKLRGECPELPLPDMAGADRLVALVSACLERQPSARPGLEAVRARLERVLRAAAGEQVTDALALPTLGLTAATALPTAAPGVPAAATELSEIPFGAIEAARRGEAAAAAALPELAQLLDAAEDEDEDDVGTELARPSLDLPAMDFATEQATPEAPPWAASQRDVATGMAVEGIPEHASSPTNRVLDALTHELTEPPEAEPNTADRQRALLGPAGVQELGPEGDHATRTFPSVDAVEDEGSTAPPPAPAAPVPVEPGPVEAAPAEEAPAAPRPDLLFASGVGLERSEEVPSSAPSSASSSALKVPPKREPPRRSFATFAVVLVLVLVALGLGGAAWIGVSDEPHAQPAPVKSDPPLDPPSVTPSATPIPQ